MKAADARVMLTGATGGIGRAMARHLLDAGASVLLVARSPARLAALSRELVRELRLDEAARVAWHAADVTDAEALPDLCDAASDRAVNVLVNNAGVPSFGRLETLAADHIAQVIETNLVAPIRLTQALLPQLRTWREAQVIQVGSALGRIGVPGFSVYGASKFGLRGFSEALRRELAGSGVRVQYLGPRATRTPFNDEAASAFNRATQTPVDPPERVAETLIALIESGRPEAFVGFPERFAVRLNGALPSLLDGGFGAHRRHLPTAPEAGSPGANAPGREAPSNLSVAPR